MNSLWPALLFIAISTYYPMDLRRIVVVLYLIAYNQLQPDDFARLVWTSLHLWVFSGHYGTDFAPLVAIFCWDFAVLWLITVHRLRYHQYDVLLVGIVDLLYNLITWVVVDAPRLVD
jgi:hypothetical protein